MGVGKRKNPTATARPVRKAPVALGGGGTPRHSDCPELATVQAFDVLVSVGQNASLTMAAGEPQLIVGSRAISIKTMNPSVSVVTKCLKSGEAYFGSVTAVERGMFTAELELVGD